jgi:hypothetical protein
MDGRDLQGGIEGLAQVLSSLPKIIAGVAIAAALIGAGMMAFVLIAANWIGG